MSLFLTALSVLLALLATVVAYFKWTFSYWKRKGLPYLEPTIPFGNTKELLLQQCSFSQQFAKHYFKIKQMGLKHAGIFFSLKPLYMPVDRELIKSILHKDFEHFTDRGMYFDEVHDPLSATLFSLDGAKWKNLRAKLSPTFTSGKMKMMFKILTECTKELHPILKESVKKHEPIDIKELMASFTTDVISSCAFGLDTSCLKHPDSEFRTIGKRVFEDGVLESLKGALPFILPHSVLSKLGLKLSKNDVEKFFYDVVEKNIKYRKNNNISRNDFFQLLLELRDSDPTFTFEEFMAQCFIFFIAGFETSSTTMMYACLELCLQEDIQDKLRKEINKSLSASNNELTYDTIMEMSYLDQVINETLRKSPPGAFLIRQCSKEYKIPGTDVILDKGVQVMISVLGLHLDPEYYPDPEVFDPDRFSPENKNNMSNVLYLPFGDGPRNCIGLRFGLMQAKVGLVTLLRNYKFTLNEKTKLPLVIDPRNIVYSPLGAIWLNVEEI